MRIGKVISTEYDDLKRRIVKFFGQGKSDVQTAKEYSPFGIDSNPLKDLIAIYSDTGVKGKSVLVGYLLKDKLAAVGETRLFSLKQDGSLSTFIWLKNNEIMELGGNSNFLTRFNELKTGFDQLKDDVNNFMTTTFPAHTHTVSGASTDPVTGAPPSPSSASIDGAKNEKIKTS